MASYTYQVGGSLPINAPTYVSRQADKDLYNTLKKGDFCYVLNSRQMGKSSLRVRAMKHLQDENYACVNIDITSIGTATITPEEWYFGVVDVIVNSLDLYDYLDVDEWWEQENKLSVVNRFSKFLREVLLKYIEQKIVIFIDEIDSILSLPFNIDDFFAVIRESYNQRVNNLAYYRLTFCLIGVATPSDLISDKKRTPFNIGTAIELSGFTLAEAQPLMLGFAAITNYPQAVMQEILKWTGGQPFLTQKVCNLLLSSLNFLKPLVTSLAQEESQEIVWVQKLVEEKIIKNWESQDEPEHLRTIQNRILVNQQTASSLLSLYQQVLNNSLKLTGNPEETRLRLTGLVVKKAGNLQVYNQVYGSIFNENWVNNELAKLRPYSESFNAWIESNCQDESRLLTGQALIDALQWAKDKNLSNQDFNFLSASQKFEQENLQIKLKLEKQLIETEKLQAQDENANLQKELNKILEKKLQFFIVVGILMTLSTIISIYFGVKVKLQNRQIEQGQIVTLIKSAEILFNSNQQFDSLLTAITMAKKLEEKKLEDSELNLILSSFLAENLNKIKEKNRLKGHLAPVYSVDFNDKYDLIISASADNTLKLWDLQGNLKQTLRGHNEKIWDVVFSPDNNLIASVSADKTIRIWNLNGKLIHQFIGGAEIYNIKFSPGGKLIASVGKDQTLKIWDINQKKLVQVVPINQGIINSISFSPDGKLIAIGGQAKSITLWDLKGNLISSLPNQKAEVFNVSFSNNGKMIVAGDAKNKIQIFSLEGSLLHSFTAHKGIVRNVEFSQDDQQIISAGEDSFIKFWSLDGTELQSYFAHTGGVWKFKFNHDQQIMVSGGQDSLVKIWNFHKNNNDISAHNKYGLMAFDSSSDGQTFVSGGADNLIKLWNKKGKLIKTFLGHKDAVMDVKFSPDNQLIASASADQTIKIWNLNGKLLKTLTGHEGTVYSIDFSPNGQTIVSGSIDQTVKFWEVQGNILQSFKTIKSNNSLVNWVSFSPDGKKIAIALQNRKIEVWDIYGNLINSITGHFDQVFYVTFNFDGSKIISASRDNTIKIWDEKGQLINTLTGHRGAVTSVTISPDHQFLASSSWDRTVKIWNINNGKLLGTLEHNDKVDIVTFTPNGKALISTSRDGLIKIWNLEKNQLINQGCAWLQDYFDNNDFLKENQLFCQQLKQLMNKRY